MSATLYKAYSDTKIDYLNDESKENFDKLKSIKRQIDEISDSNDIDPNYNSYPDYNNTNFIKMITDKQEFNYNRNEFNLNTNPCGDLSKKSDKKDFDFELGNHQIFLKNFMNNKTPYKGLLLYHGVGTGKTCSAVTIAENFKDIYGRKGDKGDIDKRIIVLVPNQNVEEGWRRNIFDITKGVYQCTGNTYVEEFNEKNVTFNEVSNKSIKINKMINKYYQFFGYREFANKVNKMVNSKIRKPNILTMTTEERDKFIIEKEKQKKNIIKQIFSNRVLIIDEVHNLRSESDGDSEDARNKKESLNMINDIVENANNLRLLLLSATPMFNEAKEILWFINILLKNDGREEITEQEIFKDGIINEELLINKSRGYISYLRGENPQSFPIRLHPCDIIDPTYEFRENCFDPKNIIKYPSKTIFNTDIVNAIEFSKLFFNQYVGPQFKKNDILINEIIEEGQTRIQLMDQMKLRQFSNIFYPNETLLDTFNKQKKSGRMMYSYKDSKEDFLQIDKLQDYSIKIHNILNCILNSEGIIFIFSEYLEYGCIPIALALERLGIKRYNDNNVYSGEKDKQKYIGENGRVSEKKSSNPASYILLTSSQELSFSKSKEIDALRSDKNISGEIVKVIIGSSTVAEGLDFKRIREVHILEPWYNLNKIEQIIGRGIRFCSHNDLIKEKRNVMVYLHAGYLEEKESIDIYLYKEAERKAKEIGKVETILKNNAIDCILNKGINHISEDDVKEIELDTPQVSSKGIVLKCKKKPSDEPYTKICSYQIDCNIGCSTEVYKPPENYDKSTINYDLLNNVIDKLTKFIKSQYYTSNLGVYTFDDLKDNIDNQYPSEIIDGNIRGRYDRDIINYTLQNIVDKRQSIINKNGKMGYLICKGEYYIFQPINENTNIPLYYRMNNIDTDIKEKNINEFYKDYTEYINDSGDDEPEYCKSIYEIIEKFIENINNSKKIVNPKYKRYSHTFGLLELILDEKVKKYISGPDIDYYENIDKPDENIKKIKTNLLYYIIDNLHEGINDKGEKHVLFRELINNFETFIKKEVSETSINFHRVIYDYLRLNFVYIDEVGNYKILEGDDDDDEIIPIGYLIMNNTMDYGDKTSDITKFYDIYLKQPHINVSKKVFNYLTTDKSLKEIIINDLDIKVIKERFTDKKDLDIFKHIKKYYFFTKKYKNERLFVLSDEKSNFNPIYEKVNIVTLKKIFKFNGISGIINNDSKIPEKLEDYKSIKSEKYHGFTFTKNDDMVLKFINLEKSPHGVMLYNTKTGYKIDDIIKIINELYSKKKNKIKFNRDSINFKTYFKQETLAVIVEMLLKSREFYIRNDLYRLMNFKRDAKK